MTSRSAAQRTSTALTAAAPFDVNCRRCPRLAKFLDAVRSEHPDYYARPVPPFGAARARVLIVGLAPGMHGANRTGRAFTGDHAGLLLYRTLHKFGFADRASSEHAADGLRLKDCRITNAVKCLPPENKPIPEEIRLCNNYLQRELEVSKEVKVVLALGKIAHDAVLRALGLKAKPYPFAHGAEHTLDDRRTLIDSYHCSRYNTQTKRLTEAMFQRVFEQIVARL
jgi:uracil-DNA glycosylase